MRTIVRKNLTQPLATSISHVYTLNNENLKCEVERSCGAVSTVKALVRAKEAEIQALEEQIIRARAYLGGLKDAMQAMQPPPSAGDEDAAKQINHGSNGQHKEIRFRAGSTVEQAYVLLKEHGQPMHIMDILAGIGRPTTKSERQSLGGQLSGYVRREQVFERPEPGKFGLLEFRDDEDSNTTDKQNARLMNI